MALIKDKDVEVLEAQVARLSKKLALVDNFLAKFGTFYDSQGNPSMFIVGQLVNGGANGVAITPQQGLIEQFALPMKIPAKDEKVLGPCWVPVMIPDKDEAIELFGGEQASGADNKASA